MAKKIIHSTVSENFALLHGSTSLHSKVILHITVQALLHYPAMLSVSGSDHFSHSIQ